MGQITGVAGGPPVILLNHASHTFWVGASIADLVLNLRQAAQDLAKRHRGVDSTNGHPVVIVSCAVPEAAVAVAEEVLAFVTRETV